MPNGPDTPDDPSEDLLRAAVIAALDRTLGLMERPDTGRAILTGQDVRLDALDLDSLGAYEIVFELEETLGRPVPPATVLQAETVAGLIANLRALPA